MAEEAKCVDASPCVEQGGYSPMTSTQYIEVALMPDLVVRAALRRPAW